MHIIRYGYAFNHLWVLERVKREILVVVYLCIYVVVLAQRVRKYHSTNKNVLINANRFVFFFLFEFFLCHLALGFLKTRLLFEKMQPILWEETSKAKVQKF